METREKNKLYLGHLESVLLYHTCHCGFVSFFFFPICLSYRPGVQGTCFSGPSMDLAQHVVNELLGSEWLKTGRQLQAKGWTALSREDL